jgi:hypothetical protein
MFTKILMNYWRRKTKFINLNKVNQEEVFFYHPFMEECQTRRDMKESEVDNKKINPKKDKNGE